MYAEITHKKTQRASDMTVYTEITHKHRASDMTMYANHTQRNRECQT